MQLKAPRNPVAGAYRNSKAVGSHELHHVGSTQQVFQHGKGATVRTALSVIYQREFAGIRKSGETSCGGQSATYVVFKRGWPFQLAVLNRVRAGRFNNFESAKLRARTPRWRSRKCFCARRPHDRTK
jgi:hypothetical protein